MTDFLKRIIIAQITIAILVLPASASEVCNCEDGNFDWDDFPTMSDAQACYECCKSPVAYDIRGTVKENTFAEIILQATDPDNDTLTFNISSGPTNGKMVTADDDVVVYAPNVNFTGVDSFNFNAFDGDFHSNDATVTIIIEPDSSPQFSQIFFGNVTIGDEPAPEYANILAVGPGVRSDTGKNPVFVQTDGFYGTDDDTAQNMVVQGSIENGTPIMFYIDGVRAEVRDVDAGGPWQSTCPFMAGEVTNLDIRVIPPVPPPDEVYINALSMTISNSSYEFSKTIKLEGDPVIEARVTSGMFNIRISATGVHRFSFDKELRRDTTLDIYENGNPVTPLKNVRFGSKVVSYDYFATGTRTFDILMYVNEDPEICDVKSITIYTTPA